MTEKIKLGRGPELRAVAERRREYERFLLDDLQILEYESSGRSDVWIYVNHNGAAFDDIEGSLDRPILQLSLMNKQMVEADRLFYEPEDRSEKAKYYKPYYFQFDCADCDHSVIKKIVRRHIESKETKGWFRGWLTPHEDKADISIPGSLLFPAPPYQCDDVYLNISRDDRSDTEAPIEIPLSDCKWFASLEANDEDTCRELREDRCDCLRELRENKCDCSRELREDRCDCLNRYEYEIEVHNVGQANLIYIRSLHRVKKILFDVGRPCGYCMPKRGTSKRGDIERKLRCLSMMKPTEVIISHWHFDHGGAAFGLDDKAMKEARWIVPDWSQIDAQWVKNLVGFLVRNSHVVKIKDASDCKRAESQLGCADISLDRGLGSDNLNDTGLILVVRDAVLPGDCDYGFWPPAVERAYACSNAFIVPHHGAATQNYIYRNPSGRLGEAFVSVDEDNNNYGHPCQNHLGLLGSEWDYERTDKMPNGNSYKFRV